MISATPAHESDDHVVLVETQGTWTIDELVQALTLTQPRQIDFTEQYISTLLTTPITKKGVFRFTPPAKLEKHVHTPQQESFTVNGDRVHYTNSAEDLDLTLSLTDYPSLRVFIGGLRSMLSGDVETLHQLYHTTLLGTKDEWTLTIIPRDEEMHEAITSILFQGRRQKLTTMVIYESSGNSSTLQLMLTQP
ncbi:MAG: hypothetical protein NPIRA01_40340 [Nitrospirales bacterium]|nr:MAG: hypothetical protein NPIRA01_40340 [Nitrospirales bacterium]